MESDGIKSSGVMRPQDLGVRPQVRRVSTQMSGFEANSDSQGAVSNRRVPETQNLVSANGQVYDRTSPRGTYLNILV